MGHNQQFYFGATGEVSIAPLFLGVLIFAAGLIVFLPRKYVIYPFLLSAILIPMTQEVVIGGLHFTTLRILIFVGWVRLLASPSAMPGKKLLRLMTNIDKAFLAWVVSNVVMFTILWGAWDAFVNRLGFAYTDLGIYFLMRFLIRDDKDVERAIRVLAIVCFVVGLLMLGEHFTGINIIGKIGGVPAIDQVREGKLRAQGPFVHPLLAGAVGATLVPLFVGLWWKSKNARRVAVMGILGACLMALASMASTSLFGLAAGLLALCLWPMRSSMRALRWGIGLTLVGLQIVMKAPVWALIARVDLIGGSSGYRRYELINQAILRFWEWWLVGTRTQSQWGWDMWDSINWYVNQATTGGLITLILFVTILVFCFKRIGTARRRSAAQKEHRNELFIWALGATLFANALSFIGIMYFDQSCAIWFTFLAMISTATTVPHDYKTLHVPSTIDIDIPEIARTAYEIDQERELLHQ